MGTFHTLNSINFVEKYCFFLIGLLWQDIKKTYWYEKLFPFIFSSLDFLEFLLVMLFSFFLCVWKNPCSHSVIASLLRNLCILCQLSFSIISRLVILKFYSSPSYGRPSPFTFLMILFSHSCIVWFLSKEIDLGSIFFSVSNMLSVNGHYYSWPFWL